jgi:hypothetical protein
LSYDFLTSNSQGSEPIHLIFENHLTRSPYTRLIPVSSASENLERTYFLFLHAKIK